jgi:3-hydroxyisobutyrate dehydrogenase-like beta-hydroxyacid dehydrogenase
MGQGVGEVLKANGLRVMTSLQGRSERTRGLAAAAGIEDAGSIEDLVQAADAILCILVPSEAVGVARSVAAAVRSTGADLLYADMNAVAPRTSREIGEIITAAGARYADGGIIGGPPRGTPPGTKTATRFYASGPGAAELAQLNQFGLNVPVIGDQVGQASGLKMCYAAMTKGVQALGIELLIAARAMGLDEALKAEQSSGGVAKVLSFIAASTPTMPPKAYRWVGEMEEIAATFEHLGLTPKMLLGAADMYTFIASTPIGKETPENRDRDRDLYGIVEALADALPEPAGAKR